MSDNLETEREKLERLREQFESSQKESAPILENFTAYTAADLFVKKHNFIIPGEDSYSIVGIYPGIKGFSDPVSKTIYGLRDFVAGYTTKVKPELNNVQLAEIETTDGSKPDINDGVWVGVFVKTSMPIFLQTLVEQYVATYCRACNPDSGYHAILTETGFNAWSDGCKTPVNSVLYLQDLVLLQLPEETMQEFAADFLKVHPEFKLNTEYLVLITQIVGVSEEYVSIKPIGHMSGIFNRVLKLPMSELKKNVVEGNVGLLTNLKTLDNLTGGK